MEDIDNITESKDVMIDTLFEISSTFNGLLEKDEILRQLAIYLMGQFAIKSFAMYVLNNDNTEYKLLVEENLDNICKVVKVEDIDLENDINIIQCTKKYKTIFNNKDIDYIISIAKNNGLLVIGYRMFDKLLTDIDFKFMMSIGELALLAIENSRLIIEEKEKLLLEQELNMALNIQKGLLPKGNPDIKNYDIIGFYKSAKSIGGDYYDFIKIDDEHYIIVIADVCGKNISAALIMSNLQSALKAQLFFISDLKEIIKNLNFLIYMNTEEDKFVTFFFGILDIKKDEFEYINCGHDPPIFYKSKDNNIKLLKADTTVLGIEEELKFNHSNYKIKFDKDDFILCYTDGITEALNKDGVMLTDKWLEDFVKTNSNLSAKELIQEINNFINNYQLEQRDDITMVVIKRK